MLLLNYTNKESFKYKKDLYTYEKIFNDSGKYNLIPIRKRKAEILILADYHNKTVSINGKEFTTTLNSEFTYKKGKGNNIEVSDFNIFIKHLKESSNRENVFYYATQRFILKLTKGQYTKIYN
tara:strand:+ start:3925 stop:4293 length:369 start_codon:yes stop_codon:yes gene_type:complete